MIQVLTMAKGKEKKLEGVGRYEGSVRNLRYLQMVVDPAGELTSAPGPMPQRYTTIRDRIVHEQTVFPTNGEFYGEVHPKTSATLRLTEGASHAETSANKLGIAAWHQVQSSSQADWGYIQSGCHLVLQATHGRRAFPLISTLGGTATLDIQMDNPANFEMVLDVSYYTTSWSLPTTLGLVRTGNTYAMTFPAGTNAMSFELSATTGMTAFVPVGMRFAITPGTALIGCGNTPYTLSTYDSDAFRNIDQLQYYRIVAMDVLVTYMGSTLNNGGVIACAQVPHRWSPNFATPFASVADLPFDSYNGPLREGAHVFWRPGSIEDLDSTHPGIERDHGHKLVFAGRIDDTTESFRVQVNFVYEYFSTNPIYGGIHFCPPLDGTLDALAWMAVHIPVASDNKNHVKKVRQLLAKGARSGFKWARDNPEKILEGFATIAPMLL